VRIYTVTCNGKPAAVVRAENPSEAIDIARELRIGLDGYIAAREPNDAEMVSWLEHRDNHALPEAAAYAA
jgi:acyl-CoA reductase-like NAD-dependent aldehyde dehydrogenase